MSAVVKRHGSYFLRFLLGVLLGLSISANAMTPMTDNQLSDVSGQALLFAQKTAGVDLNSIGAGDYSNLTFYRMGLDGTVDINTNINHLRLGCGGVNGTGNCDISIDNMALSGGTGPGSDATLTRPFVELAVLGDGSATGRQVVGFRFSAEGSTGVLTTGVNTPSPNGINTLSGFMMAQSGPSTGDPNNPGTGACASGQGCIYGLATTAEGWFAGHPCNKGYNPCDPMNGGMGTYLTMNSYIDSPIGGGHIGVTLVSDPQSASNSGIHLLPQSVPFTGTPAVVNGKRLTATTTTVGGPVPTIALPYAALMTHPIYCYGDSILGVDPCGLLSNDVTAYSSNSTSAPPSGCGSPPNYPSCNPTGTSGSISGLNLSATFSETLGYIHTISVDNAPFSLSFQKQPVYWPGSHLGTDAATTNVAQTGWWMGFDSPVYLGELRPQNPVDLSTAPGVYSQLADKMQYLFSAVGAGLNPSTGEGSYFSNHPGANGTWVFASNNQHYCGGANHTGDCSGAALPTSGAPGPLHLSGSQAWDAIANNPSYVYVILPNLAVSGTAANITTTLSDVQLSHTTQDVPTNCWGAAPNTQPCFN